MAYSPTVDDSGGAENDGRLDADEISRVLADEYRRAILETFDHRDAPVDIETLAAEVVKRVHTTEETEQVMISLHHTHLPVLDHLDIIEYDREYQNVTEVTVSYEQLTTQH